MATPPKTKLNPDEIAFLDVAGNGQAATVKELLARGVGVDVRDSRFMPRDVTPVMRAAAAGHVHIEPFLINARAKLDARAELKVTRGRIEGGKN